MTLHDVNFFILLGLVAIAIGSVYSRRADRKPQRSLQVGKSRDPGRPIKVDRGELVGRIAGVKDRGLTRMAWDFEALRRQKAADALLRAMADRAPSSELAPLVRDAFGSAEVHPPRHARLAPGVSWTVLHSDIVELILAADVLDRTLAVGFVPEGELDRWNERLRLVLGSVTKANPYHDEPNLPADIDLLYSGDQWHAIAAQKLGDAGVRRAMLAVGVEYLSEVQRQMPNYRDSADARPGEPGEETAQADRSVTHNYTFTNHGHTQIAIGSNDFVQKVAADTADSELADLADLLDRFSAAGHGNSDEATAVADEIRQAGADPDRPKEALRSLMTKAIATVAVAAGTELGQQITNLAVSTIQQL